MIQKPEALQETVNSEMVEYLDKVQRQFLEVEVAESAENKEEYLADVKLACNVNATYEIREAAENRIKNEVLKHGVWIGHGDLLTVKMFYVAKSLRLVLIDYLRLGSGGVAKLIENKANYVFQCTYQVMSKPHK